MSRFAGVSLGLIGGLFACYFSTAFFQWNWLLADLGSWTQGGRVALLYWLVVCLFIGGFFGVATTESK